MREREIGHIIDDELFVKSSRAYGHRTRLPNENGPVGQIARPHLTEYVPNRVSRSTVRLNRQCSRLA